jgi:hypothetical protein
MADNAGLAAALDGIPMVADAAAREARFPLATRKQNQRVFRLDTGVQERWSGSAWVDDTAQVFNVRRFGAAGNGTSDDTTAIQAAIDAAQASGATGVVFFPEGNFIVTSALTVDPAKAALIFKGVNRNTSLISVPQTAPLFNAVFDLPDVLCDAFEWHDLRIDGGSGVPRAAYCIYAPRLSHSLVRRCDIRYSRTAGILLSYGWSNDLEDNRIWLHDGDGVVFDYHLVGGINGNNALTVTNNKIYDNAGIGLNLQYSYGVSVTGNTFEQNAKCAIMAWFANRGLHIAGNYFEGNANTGVAYTVPSKTVKADIILNGTDHRTGLFLNVDPIMAVVVEGNLVSSLYTGAFVYAISAKGLAVRNNYTTSDVPALMSYPDLRYASLDDVDVSGNTGMTHQVGMDGFATWQSADFAEVRIAGTPATNFWTHAVGSLTRVQSTTGGTIRQSATQYGGWPAVEITGVASSDTWGVTLDLATRPELQGQLVMLACYMSGPSTAGGNLFCDATVNTNGPTYDIDQSLYTFGTTAWNKHVLIAKMPSTGTVSFGIRKCAGLSGDVVAFSRLVLARLGAGYANTAAPLATLPDTVSADRGDASVTLVADIDAPTQRFATTLTANRTVTLSATNARNGSRFRVVRTGLGAFTLDVGGLKTIAASTAAFVDVAYDGTAWRLAGYGAL